ncbi:DUF411 domain-containing protein [Pseudoroseicyclus tamaricis]|uniref:DUF411 domain-containing protein n=1 Tax=Pseudoroseicyclus tamaricis TaxID=2705421 RepID=A0A6B2JHV3_9RHOB|nr:DUF411 domain-containing protein [Pseudoroseicyclus tamaricis]NDV00911.1 DUF411 domain-containing protein [Pseudoroseicyclus tamaricis]
MIRTFTTRRAILFGGTALAASALLPLRGRAAGPAIHVLKDPNCGCCTAWIEILEQEGFDVTVEAARGATLAQYKTQNGIPVDMISCHTGEIEGYMIEGHVPVADIRRLLDERPEAVGLAVPGMPYGSPGMGPESRRDAYDVHLILPDGSTEVFTRYDAA